MSRINRLEVKQLRLLQALLREQNVSRVAAQVGLTQQAVSDQLRKLRDIFDDRLFVRSSNGLVATPVAQALGVKVDKLLADFEGLLEPTVFEPTKVTSTYVIAATDYAQQVVLPLLLNKIRMLAPGLKIIIRDFDIDSLPELMVTGRVNLALTFDDIIPAAYPYLTLFRDHYVCVAAKHSPLAQRQLSLQDIAAQPQIVVSPSRANFCDAVDVWFEAAGLKRNVIISVPCFSLLPGYIEKTDAIAFLPSRELPNNKLTQLALIEKPTETIDFEAVDFEVVAAWHTRSGQDPLHNWVISLLKQAYVLKAPYTGC